MYIRKTTTKKAVSKTKPRQETYRLVESIRVGDKVQQKTVLNLGVHFDVAPCEWKLLCQRIEELLDGNPPIPGTELNLPTALESSAQHYTKKIINMRSEPIKEKTKQTDYHSIDVNTLEHKSPRSIGCEYMSHETIKALNLPSKLGELGFNGVQIHRAIGSIVGRLIQPGSELLTHKWLQNSSSLGELMDYDFNDMSLTSFYRVADKLYDNKSAIEQHLYQRQNELFELDNAITLYDLTNTYFEGSMLGSELAHKGRSKEKRSDCSLATLALATDSEGFIKHSEVYEGNISESATFIETIETLEKTQMDKKPIVIMDAGIATEKNVKWQQASGYPYIVVSRKRKTQDATEMVTIKEDGDYSVKAKKIINEKEIELYCLSTAKAHKSKQYREK